MAEPIRTTQANDMSEVVKAINDATGTSMSPALMSGLIVATTLGVALTLSIFIFMSKANEQDEDHSAVLKSIFMSVIIFVVLLAFIFLATV